MLLRAGLRELGRRKLQTALAFLGIAVGAAVVVAIDTASNSVRRGFDISSETVNGRATHRISAGPTGVDERVYTRLKRAGTDASLAPFVSGIVHVGDRRGPGLRILGIAPLADGAIRGYLNAGDTAPGSLSPSDPFVVYMTSNAAQRIGASTGDSFDLVAEQRTTRVRLGALLAPQEDLYREALADAMVADIALAQHVLSMRGRLTHIDVVARSDDAALALDEALPTGVRLDTAGARNLAQRGMLKALDTNLMALGLLALLIGVFLIYNTMTFSVVQRRQSIGMLRAVGVTRAEVACQVLAQAALLGAVASLVGIGLGLLLAKGLVITLTQTVSDLYFRTEVAQLDISTISLLRGWLLGVVATVCAAALPALEATRTPPRAVMSRADLENRAVGWSRRALMAGLAMMMLSVVLLMLPVQSLLPAFAGLFLLITGFALLIPHLVPLIVGGFVRLFSRRGDFEAVMGARYVMRSTSRTGVAVAALAVAVSATLGVGIMISSFRLSVIDWLEHRLRADVYLTMPAQASMNTPFLSALGNLDGVTTLGYAQRGEVFNGERSINLFALHTTLDGFTGYVPDGASASALWRSFSEEQAVLVSEPYANRHGVSEGDAVVLPTGLGDHAFQVAAIYTDYGSDRGVVLMARSTYVAFFNDTRVSAASLSVRDSADAGSIKERVLALADAPPGLEVFSNRDLKDASLVVFDRTFAVTEILRLLAVIVAAIGIVSALMALQFDRARDFAVLRAIGVTPLQIVKLATVETALMGLASGLAAVPLGVLTAWILVRVVNERSFGWSMGFYPDPALMLQGIALALLAAVFAGVIPTWRLLRLAPAANLRDE